MKILPQRAQRAQRGFIQFPSFKPWEMRLFAITVVVICVLVAIDVAEAVAWVFRHIRILIK